MNKNQNVIIQAKNCIDLKKKTTQIISPVLNTLTHICMQEKPSMLC